MNLSVRATWSAIIAIIFKGPSDQLELFHHAESRDIFASGALQAAALGGRQRARTLFHVGRAGTLMIYCRFQSGDVQGWGVVEQHEVWEVSPDIFSPFEKTGRSFSDE